MINKVNQQQTTTTTFAMENSFFPHRTTVQNVHFLSLNSVHRQDKEEDEWSKKEKKIAKEITPRKSKWVEMTNPSYNENRITGIPTSPEQRKA